MDKLLFEKLLLDELSLNKLSLDKLSLDKLLLDKLSSVILSLVQLSGVSVVHLSLDEFPSERLAQRQGLFCAITDDESVEFVFGGIRATRHSKKLHLACIQLVCQLVEDQGPVL